ncbi:N-6 DNA methylase [Corynebacterium glutamicum]|uniref:N-6 DNA methylase n=1 Tax=Corynebacterium glutamicum TaxID=1718 RepID=UPI000771F3DC|nr:N-6 DNA methylase [Corynebacterium glutamicum]AMK79457.1 hypothetical protein APT58_15300 [Corynebacterium glutamicum]
MTTSYQGQLSLKDIAELAGVGRPAVSNWRARNESFPAPVKDSSPRRPLFHFNEIMEWLIAEESLPDNWQANATSMFVSSAINPLSASSGDTVRVAILALAVLAAHKNNKVETWSNFQDADENIHSALHQFLSPLAPHVLSSDQLEDIITSAKSVAGVVLETLVSGLERINKDSYGHAAQMIIDAFFGRAGRSVFGQYATSATVSKLLINAASTTTDAGATIFDPTCGTSGVLLGLGSRIDNATIIGNDVNKDSITISILRAYLEGLDASFTASDVLVHDPQPQLRADTIISEPPFSLRVGSEDFKSVTDSITALLGVKIPQASSGDAAFLTYPINHLSSKGRAYVLTAPSLCVLDRLDDFRRNLVARGMVEAIVQLPQKLLNTTSIATTLWVLRTPDQSKDAAAVLLADASNVEFPDEHIAEWLTAMRKGKTTTIPTGSITLADMVTEGSNLLPSHVLAQLPSSDEVFHTFDESWISLSNTAQSIKEILPSSKPAVEDIPTTSSMAPITKLESITRIATRSWKHDEERPEDTVSAHLIQPRNSEDSSEIFIKGDAQTLLPGDILIPSIAVTPAWVFGDKSGKWVAPSSIFALRVNDDSFLPEYLAACINAPFNVHEDGTRIPRRRLTDIKIPLLSIEEQQKVVEVSESLQRLAEQAKQLAAEAEATSSAVANLIYFGADV